MITLLRGEAFRLGPRSGLTILAGACCLCATGCVSGSAGSADGWRAEVIEVPSPFGPNAVLDTTGRHFRGDAGYRLHLLVDAVGIDFSSSLTFCETLRKHPKGPRKARTVGHCWLILESPEGILECGHTGEFGYKKPTYYRGLLRRLAAGDPNPSAYLFESMSDGRFHRGPGGHAPTVAASMPITRDQHRAILNYINTYDYKDFRMTGQACNDFPAGAAALAGLRVSHQIRLTLPAEVVYRGTKRRLWTDDKYREIVIGSPDVLERFLGHLVREGVLEDSLEWYYGSG